MNQPNSVSDTNYGSNVNIVYNFAKTRWKYQTPTIKEEIVNPTNYTDLADLVSDVQFFFSNDSFFNIPSKNLTFSLTQTNLKWISVHQFINGFEPESMLFMTPILSNDGSQLYEIVFEKYGNMFIFNCVKECYFPKIREIKEIILEKTNTKLYVDHDTPNYSLLQLPQIGLNFMVFEYESDTHYVSLSDSTKIGIVYGKPYSRKEIDDIIISHFQDLM